MQIESKRIMRRLVVYLTIILLSLSLISYAAVNKMADLTGDLYIHPFTVSAAVFRINADILRVRHADNNLVSASTPEEVQIYQAIINQTDARVLADFQLVEERYLGDPATVHEALQAFSAWKSIREEVISLALQGRRQEAADLAKLADVPQAAEVESKLTILSDFAKNRAESFYADAQEIRKKVLGLVLLSSTLALLLAGFLFRKAINMEDILQKNNEQLEAAVKERTGELAAANQQLIAHSEELTAMNNELTAMNEGIAALNEELEMRIEERTADLTAANEELTTTEEELRAQLTELLETQEALHREMALTNAVFDSVPGMLYLYDDQGKLVRWNKQHEEMTGYSEQELSQMHLTDWYKGDDETIAHITQRVQKALQKGFADAEANLQSKEGIKIPMYFTAVPLVIEGKTYFAGIGIDITERKLANEKLKHLALYDPLTQLYNRGYFEKAMQRLDKRYTGSVGLIICDVDGLKLINDTLGHQQGDIMLTELASILTRCFRSTDIVARIGGDEFAVIIVDVTETLIQTSCEQVQTEISRYNADNRSIPISLSTGYAIAADPAVSMSELYKAADYNMYREKLLREQSSRNAIVQTVMKLLEVRDLITEEHAERLQDLVSGLGYRMGLPEGKIIELRLLAQFHDVGKVGIPDRILMKPGPLTPEEMAEMQRHCDIGYRIALLSPELAPLADWILKHQERWDGSGYPLGLAGEAIPLECRILAIADAYDAMTSNRPYRKAMSSDAALNELKCCSGKQFDPTLVKLFIDVWGNKESSQKA